MMENNLLLFSLVLEGMTPFTKEKFRHDLKIAKPFEDWNEKLFQYLGYKTRRSNVKGWDIECIRWENALLRDFFTECKDQPKSLQTNNYFLERQAILDAVGHYQLTNLPHYFSTGVIHNARFVSLKDIVSLFNAHDKTHGGNTFVNPDGSTRYNPGAPVPMTEFSQFIHLQ